MRKVSGLIKQNLGCILIFKVVSDKAQKGAKANLDRLKRGNKNSEIW